MTKPIRNALLLFVLLVWTGVVRADITPEALDQGKRATVLVEIGNEHYTPSLVWTKLSCITMQPNWACRSLIQKR